MRDFFESLLRSGPDRGFQLAAYRDGRLVLDVSAGVADEASGLPVAPDTLFPIFSISKGVTAALVHRLVDRGLFSHDTRIAAIWPEFGRKGKEGITVRQALSHQSGLPLMPTGIGFAELCDWKAMCAAIAELHPVATPPGEMIYHSATFGWILGEVACRATGQTFGELLESEIKRPLGLKDLYIGIPDGVEGRIATVYEPATAMDQAPPDDGRPHDIPRWMWPLGDLVSRPDIRRCAMPAVNGIANARSVARLFSGLISARLGDAAQEHALQPLPPPSPPRRMGLGFFLGGPGAPEMSLRPDAFGHGGYGSLLGYADPAYGLAVGFLRNYLSDEPIRIKVMQKARQVLGIPED